MTKQWKQAERSVAARVGGQRVSNHALGLRTPDCESDWLSVEVKLRKRLPLWLSGALAQAETNATPGKLPVAVLHQAGQRYDDALVVVRLADFTAWFLGPNDSLGELNSSVLLTGSEGEETT